jgi:hypothetical protein
MVSRGLLEMEYSLWHCVAILYLEISHASNHHTHNLMAHNLSIGSHNSNRGDNGLAWTS